MVSYVSNCPSTIKEFFLSPMIIDTSIYAHMVWFLSYYFTAMFGNQYLCIVIVSSLLQL